MSGSKFKKGDRVRMNASRFRGQAGTVTYVSYHGYPIVTPDGHGHELAFGDHELELIPKFDFTIGDKLTTTGWAHTPERWVQVEWIGPSQFAGETNDGKKVVHDFASANSNWQKWVRTYHFPFKVGDRVRLSNGCGDGLLVTEISPPDEHWWKSNGLRYRKESSLYTWELVPEPVPVHPFKVGDKVRNSIDSYPWPAVVTNAWFDRAGTPMVNCTISDDPGCTWTNVSAKIWEHYVEPATVEKPVVKKWLVTTEEGKPKKGDVFVDSRQHRFSISGLDFIHTTTNVITSVQPLTNLNDWIVGGDGK